MYRRLGSGDDDVLGFEVEGTISQESFEELLGEVRRAIDRFGGVRLLVRVHGWPAGETPPRRATAVRQGALPPDRALRGGR